MTLGGMDRDIADRVAGAEEGHRDGGGVGEPVRQEIQEAFEALGAHHAEAGGQVENLVARDQGRESIVEAVGERAADAGLGAVATRADHHVVARVELGEQARDVLWIVLAVGVYEDQDVAGRSARPGLDGCAVAEAVGVRDDPGAVGAGDLGRLVGRAVVDQVQLGLRQRRTQSWQQIPERFGLVLGRQDHRQECRTRFLVLRGERVTQDCLAKFSVLGFVLTWCSIG